MILQDNLGPNGDTIYNALMHAHEGLTEAESHALNARLVLMLINEVADPDRIAALLQEARRPASSV
ncbi:Protein of unknown function [Pseudosulfitobacter pseudonitzschiae]|uniref:DUF2783 domain-containing protein n=2 Tax=Pseudosulfitobacter pseudonitzschiae TaxID=1402135 RepID=A0A073J037_9RHOB|nr:DUF2783 domain-containing protein [Pseudosulfitobacter pseudonitzschiae]KEJ95046.1 hypothetical protein SUH3_23370 [Pseudosulfitobacter pseudonitzschiae]QKS07568.1 DUF2783 domain-containing protein [Pseudosulfitobacter pseudonitzschiae]SHF18204.1 Protein of unknown function [Pseudosulfitobacter pseudonitzschiae]